MRDSGRASPRKLQLFIIPRTVMASVSTSPVAGPSSVPPSSYISSSAPGAPWPSSSSSYFSSSVAGPSIPYVTVFNCEPHSGSGGSEFPAPFRTRNRRKHFNCLTISYVRLNLSLPFVTAPITIHYKLHSGPSGGLIRVYLRPWYIYTFILLTSTSVVFVHLRQQPR